MTQSTYRVNVNNGLRGYYPGTSARAVADEWARDLGFADWAAWRAATPQAVEFDVSLADG